MAQIGAIVEPDSTTYDIWRESVAFLCVHPPILTIPASLFGNTQSMVLLGELVAKTTLCGCLQPVVYTKLTEKVAFIPLILQTLM